MKQQSQGVLATFNFWEVAVGGALTGVSAVKLWFEFSTQRLSDIVAQIMTNYAWARDMLFQPVEWAFPALSPTPVEKTALLLCSIWLALVMRTASSIRVAFPQTHASSVFIVLGFIFVVGLIYMVLLFGAVVILMPISIFVEQNTDWKVILGTTVAAGCMFWLFYGILKSSGIDWWMFALALWAFLINVVALAFWAAVLLLLNEASPTAVN